MQHRDSIKKSAAGHAYTDSELAGIVEAAVARVLARSSLATTATLPPSELALPPSELAKLAAVVKSLLTAPAPAPAAPARPAASAKFVWPADMSAGAEKSRIAKVHRVENEALIRKLEEDLRRCDPSDANCGRIRSAIMQLRANIAK